MMTSRIGLAGVLVALAGVIGCEGSIADPVERPRGGTGGVAPPPIAKPPRTSQTQCVSQAIGPSPLRRLTHAEYNNAVADLLGDKTHPASAFPPDHQAELFDNMADTQTVPVLLAGGYVDSAVKLASNVTDLPALVGCDFVGASGAPCMRGFIQRFGRRAYRARATEPCWTAPSSSGCRSSAKATDIGRTS